MAHSKSAEKRIRQNATNRERNRTLMGALRTQMKKARAALESKDVERARTECAVTARALDRAATKGIVHKNNASRHKARLAAALAKLQPSA